MKNARKLKSSMQPGRAYRRQDLEGFSSAVDRDLKTLVERGDVKRLAGGLYYCPRRNPFGIAPPDDRDIVRAFLKTDDFLLTSYNHFNQLGLGLTQVYNSYVVYNHKRSGDFSLGGKRFEFRVVPEYPRKLSKEFLLVDLLNNLKRLPDDTSAVPRNLKARLSEFDQEKLRVCLGRFGRPAAKAALRKAYA
ncbi:hypothetical protein ACFL6Y_06495 [Elusimicrobiota bacterium]